MSRTSKSTIKTTQEIIEHGRQAAYEDIRRRNEEKAANTNFTDLFAVESTDSNSKAANDSV